MLAKAILAMLSIVGGVSGGLLLANFTIGGEDTQIASSDLSWATSVPERQALPTSELAEAADGPQHYSCKGCGLTLAERHASLSNSDYGVVTDHSEDRLEPLPTYQEHNEEPSLQLASAP